MINRPQKNQVDRVHELNTQTDFTADDIFHCDLVDLDTQRYEWYWEMTKCNQMSKSGHMQCDIHIHAAQARSYNPNQHRRKSQPCGLRGETINTEGKSVVLCLHEQYQFQVVNRDVKPYLGLK